MMIKQNDRFRPHDIGAARAADEIPVDDERLQHYGECERRDGEKRPAQPQRQIAHAEADNAGDNAANDDQDGDRHGWILYKATVE